MLVSKHFFFVHCTNLMHASANPLLYWLCSDDTTQWMSIHLQKSWNIFETNFVPASDISLMESLYSTMISYMFY